MVLSAADRRVSWPAGTVAVPVAEKAYEVFNVDENPHKSIVENFGPESGSSFPGQPLVAGRYSEFGFALPFIGGGSATVPSILGRLLQACGLTEATIAYTCAEPIVQVPVDLKYSASGVQWLMKNNVGSFMLACPGARIPTIAFKFRGNVDSTEPKESEETQIDTAAMVAPYPVQGNTFTITPGTASAISVDCLEWDYNAQNSIYPSPDVTGSYGFDIPQIVARNHDATLHIEVDDLDVYDASAQFLAGAVQHVSTYLEKGNGIGQEVAVTFGGYIAERPTWTRNEDAYIWQIKLSIAKAHGISLSWKAA